MAQSNFIVHESLKQLRSLITQYRGSRQESRVRMLLLIKENPLITIATIASTIQVPQPTLKRWRGVYRTKGLTALLTLRSGRNLNREEDTRINDLKQMLNTGDIRTIHQVREWLLNTADEDGSIDGATEKSNEQALLSDLSAGMVKLLNTLPVTMDHVDWIHQFQRLLKSILPDVDRFIIAVNTECDLVNPENYRPSIEAVQIVPTKDGRQSRRMPKVAGLANAAPYKRVEKTLQDDKFPFDEYHPPQFLDFYFHGTAHVGTIVVLRYVTKPPIPDRTIECMKALERFMVFMFTDCIVRQKQAQPIGAAFNNALEQLARQYELSTAEYSVFVLRLLGQSYEGIAETLHVSMNTVRFHVRNIHEKTGAGSLAELFARFFTPLLPLPKKGS